MRTAKFAVRDQLEERIHIAVSPAEKQRICELAARKQKTVSQVIREAVASAVFAEQRAA